MGKRKKDFDNDYKIDEKQFEIDPDQYEIEDENKPRPTSQLEAAVEIPVNEETETTEFPWKTGAIIVGVLIALIVICFIVVMVLGPEDVLPPSSQISGQSV